MRKLFLFAAILILQALAAKAQHTLTVRITDLENNEGHVLLELQNANEQIVKTAEQEIMSNTCTIVIPNLSPGKYAFRYLHDENSNEKVDTYWIGAPKEGFGYSNNAKGKIAIPPGFDETSFTLKSDTMLLCTPMYIKF